VERIPRVVGRKQCATGGGVRLADEAEEGFPAAGDDEAEELGVGGGYLVGVNGFLSGGLGLWDTGRVRGGLGM